MIFKILKIFIEFSFLFYLYFCNIFCFVCLIFTLNAFVNFACKIYNFCKFFFSIKRVIVQKVFVIKKDNFYIWKLCSSVADV